MAKAFILAELTIPDAEAYRASGYLAMAQASVAAFGGRFLVRGGNPQPLEGDAPDRIVILEFPSREAAVRFHASDHYAPAIRLRQSLSNGRLVLLDEFAGDA